MMHLILATTLLCIPPGKTMVRFPAVYAVGTVNVGFDICWDRRVGAEDHLWVWRKDGGNLESGACVGTSFDSDGNESQLVVP